MKKYEFSVIKPADVMDENEMSKIIGGGGNRKSKACRPYDDVLNCPHGPIYFV